MISLKTHNVLDYVFGAVLILCPYIFGFSDVNAARVTFLVFGIAVIAYSLASKMIRQSVHMGLDASIGVLLLIAPWLFGYSNNMSGGQLSLHFVLGLFAIAIATFTDRPKGLQRDATTETKDESEDIRDRVA